MWGDPQILYSSGKPPTSWTIFQMTDNSLLALIMIFVEQLHSFSSPHFKLNVLLTIVSFGKSKKLTVYVFIVTDSTGQMKFENASFVL